LTDLLNGKLFSKSYYNLNFMMRRQFIKGSAILGAGVTNPMIAKAGSGLINAGFARKIYRVLDSNNVMVGTLPVIRAFAGDQNDYVSPFVLFDEFGPVKVEPGKDALKVDAHPHAGVIPTSYFIEGSGHHKDSLNHDFQIDKGEFMMFSSGKGAIHMEESGKKLFEDGGTLHGFQIWLNMPANYKFDDPTTSVFGNDYIDTINTDQYEIKVVLGELFEAKSKVEVLSPAFYYHITMKENSRLDIPTDPTHNAFIFNVSGELELGDNKILTKSQIALFQRGESTIELFSKCGGEFLLLGGKPLNEPVFSYGPFVMNNEAQIRQCMQNYNAGKMGDPNKVN